MDTSAWQNGKTTSRTRLLNITIPANAAHILQIPVKFIRFK
jgi:hypothetical protein